MLVIYECSTIFYATTTPSALVISLTTVGEGNMMS